MRRAHGRAVHRAALALAAGIAAACGGKGSDDVLKQPEAAAFRQTAPASFRVRFETTKGAFVIEATRAWAPNGVDRFYNLAGNGYYDGTRFFRVVPDFVVQWGIHGDPSVNTAWRTRSIPDDPVTQSNTRGMVTFAMAGPNTRTTQLFINLRDNTALDEMGFAPIGKVVEGMDVVDRLYAGYGEGAPRGRGPDQGRMHAQGNEYLERYFPNLDFIRAAVVEGKP
ncbi:MAG: peptidylprolyl isomerase [Gemmatimonadetes bacterium]|nr:peptidylprolyl isomerase [Gemmatimonadota bacterium]